MGPSSTLRRGDWKLIYYHADQHFELFNLARDLGEEHNVATRQPNRVREMAAELTQVLQECGAPAKERKLTSMAPPGIGPWSGTTDNTMQPADTTMTRRS
jgi:arylsulfatase A-like enzyme